MGLPDIPSVGTDGNFVETSIDALPAPEKTPHAPKSLSLNEAILLALRNDPDVISSELQRVVDKFALEVAYYNYQPQFSINGASTTQKNSNPAYAVSPTVSLLTPLGTQLSTTYTNNFDGGAGSGTIEVVQPLIRGAGIEYNMVTMRNAADQERIAKLTFKSAIITAVDAVISAYRTLVQDYNNLEIQKRTAERAEETVEQYKLKYKTGKASQSDLLQQESTLESYRLDVVQTQTSLDSDYQTFLQSLGLDANAKVKIDQSIDIGHYEIPDLQKCVQVALNNNMSYLQAMVTLNITRRALLVAKSNARWQLNLTATQTLNDGSTAGDSDSDSLELSLQVPIDDKTLQQAVVDAKIALAQAELSLRQTKQALVSAVTSQWQTVKNQYQQVVVSRKGVELQSGAVRDGLIKLQYGKTTVFEVNQLKDELLSDQTSLVSSEISYLNSITTLESTLGITLDRWKVKLRY